MGERDSGGGGTLADAILFPERFSSLFNVNEMSGDERPVYKDLL